MKPGPVTSLSLGLSFPWEDLRKSPLETRQGAAHKAPLNPITEKGCPGLQVQRISWSLPHPRGDRSQCHRRPARFQQPNHLRGRNWV